MVGVVESVWGLIWSGCFGGVWEDEAGRVVTSS